MRRDSSARFTMHTCRRWSSAFVRKTSPRVNRKEAPERKSNDGTWLEVSMKPVEGGKIGRNDRAPSFMFKCFYSQHTWFKGAKRKLLGPFS